MPSASPGQADHEKECDELFWKIGELEMHRDFLEKKLTESRSMKVHKALMDTKSPVSIRAQAKLLDVNRSYF